MRVRPHQLASEGLPDGDYSVHIEDGVVSWVAIPEPAPSNFLIAVIAGSPSMVFDSDGQIVYAEV